MRIHRPHFPLTDEEWVDRHPLLEVSIGTVSLAAAGVAVYGWFHLPPAPKIALVAAFAIVTVVVEVWAGLTNHRLQDTTAVYHLARGIRWLGTIKSKTDQATDKPLSASTVFARLAWATFVVIGSVLYVSALTNRGHILLFGIFWLGLFVMLLLILCAAEMVDRADQAQAHDPPLPTRHFNAILFVSLLASVGLGYMPLPTLGIPGTHLAASRGVSQVIYFFWVVITAYHAQGIGKHWGTPDHNGELRMPKIIKPVEGLVRGATSFFAFLQVSAFADAMGENLPAP
jgi:hypothetical protein